MKLTMIVLVSFLLIFVGCSSSNMDSNQLGEFATCLNDEGAMMYGTFWCAHCSKTKSLFSSSFKNVNYIECDPRGDDEQAEYCIEKKIEGYPTWEFKDGSRLAGELSLQILSEKTGCVLPEEN